MGSLTIRPRRLWPPYAAARSPGPSGSSSCVVGLPDDVVGSDKQPLNWPPAVVGAKSRRAGGAAADGQGAVLQRVDSKSKVIWVALLRICRQDGLLRGPMSCDGRTRAVLLSRQTMS